MVVRTLQRAKAAALPSRVIVATDSVHPPAPLVATDSVHPPAPEMRGSDGIDNQLVRIYFILAP